MNLLVKLGSIQRLKCHQSSSLHVSTTSFRIGFILLLLGHPAASGLHPFCWVTRREKSDLLFTVDTQKSWKLVSLGLLVSYTYPWTSSSDQKNAVVWLARPESHIQPVTGGVKLSLSRSYGLRMKKGDRESRCCQQKKREWMLDRQKEQMSTTWSCNVHLASFLFFEYVLLQSSKGFNDTT